MPSLISQSNRQRNPQVGEEMPQKSNGENKMQYTGYKWLVHFHLPMIPIALMSKPRRANNGRLKKSSVSSRNGWKNSNTEDTWNQESQQTAIKKKS